MAAAVDGLLEEYLDTLHEYQTAHVALERHLQTAYFDLARAKLALGPTRVSQASYDLSEKVPSVAVTITPSQSSDSNPQTVTLSLGPSAAPPATPSSKEEPASSTLRNRTNTTTTTPKPPSSSSSSAPAASSPDEKPPPPRVRDPIEQFSAFPPPALRTSQAAFSNATRAAVEVAQVKLRLDNIERRIAAARKREKKKEGELGNAEVLA